MIPICFYFYVWHILPRHFAAHTIYQGVFIGIFNNYSLSRTVVTEAFLYTRVVYDFDLAVYDMI